MQGTDESAQFIRDRGDVRVFRGGWPDVQSLDKQGVDIVFAIEPPLLDEDFIAALAATSVRIVLVQKGHRAVDALTDFLKIPNAISQLCQLGPSLLFLQSAPKKWFFSSGNLDQKASLLVLVSRDFQHVLRGYSEDIDWIVFEDLYRRSMLGDISPAGSARHYLQLLESHLEGSGVDAHRRAMQFRTAFPFLQSPAAHAQFSYSENPDDLAVINDELLGSRAPQSPELRGLALACISEVGSNFIHQGRADLYQLLIGTAIRISDGECRIELLDQDALQRIEDKYPHLYLHLAYRSLNQYLISELDQVACSGAIQNLVEPAEQLLASLLRKQASVQKHDRELGAIHGTLAQLKTFSAREQGIDRQYLIDQAKTHAVNAVKLAPSYDISRDSNYWLQSVLTGWVFQDDSLSRYEAEVGDVAERIDQLVDSEPANGFNLMFACLAATVEQALGVPSPTIRPVLSKHRIDASFLLSIQQQHASYALALAAGYFAMLDSSDADDRAALLDFGNQIFDQFDSGSRILRIVRLKFDFSSYYVMRCCELDTSDVVARLRQTMTDQQINLTPKILDQVLQVISTSTHSEPSHRLLATIVKLINRIVY